MTTPKDMADVTNYLYAAQALTPVDGMSAVWADYVNAEIPDLAASDLLPAARLCLKKWAHEGRSWKVDLPRFVEACRYLRRERWQAFKSEHGDLYPEGDLTSAEFTKWRAGLISSVQQGASCEAAEAFAWQQIGRTPPALEATENHETPAIGRKI